MGVWKLYLSQKRHKELKVTLVCCVIWERSDVISAVVRSSSALHAAVKYRVGVWEEGVGFLVTKFTTSNPLDFFFWIYTKDEFYVPPLKSNVGKFKRGNKKSLWESLTWDSRKCLARNKSRSLWGAQPQEQWTLNSSGLPTHMEYLLTVRCQYYTPLNFCATYFESIQTFRDHPLSKDSYLSDKSKGKGKAVTEVTMTSAWSWPLQLHPRLKLHGTIPPLRTCLNDVVLN